MNAVERPLRTGAARPTGGVRARLVAIGTAVPGWVAEGFQEYRRRLEHVLPLELIEIPAGGRARGRRSARPAVDEAQCLLSAIPAGHRLIALDGGGRAYSSEALAKAMQAWQMEGRDLVFAIGGADGFEAEVRERADDLWSLGPATLPHALVRVIVAEQLYRATTILSGHPYHRGA